MKKGNAILQLIYLRAGQRALSIVHCPLSSIHYRLVLSMFVLLWLAGCSSGEEGSIEPPPSINLSDLLPDEWSFREYEEINIDENPQWVEQLIFFNYDKKATSGSINPVGATIYDSQHDGRLQTGEDEQMPNQASAMLVPYRLLPSYWEGGGQGFVAQSNEQIELNLVNRLHHELGRAAQRLAPTPTPNLEEGEATPTLRPAPAIAPADELIIWGGSQAQRTRMTVVWWKNTHEGYGFTQVYAPGGLYDIQWEEDSIAGEKPVRWLRGSWPRNDRSMLCYDVRYTRMLDPARDGQEPWQLAVQYVATPLGLTFCHGTPTHPFYPESVVLAYLLDPENSSHLVDQQQSSLVQKVIGNPRSYYVDKILTSPTINSVEPVETYVCVELMKSDGAVLPEQLAPYENDKYPIFYQTQRQLLNFRLHHDKPKLENIHSSDRLKIVNVSEIDSPSSDHIINDCDHHIR